MSRIFASASNGETRNGTGRYLRASALRTRQNANQAVWGGRRLCAMAGLVLLVGLWAIAVHKILDGAVDHFGARSAQIVRDSIQSRKNLGVHSDSDMGLSRSTRHFQKHDPIVAHGCKLSHSCVTVSSVLQLWHGSAVPRGASAKPGLEMRCIMPRMRNPIRMPRMRFSTKQLLSFRGYCALDDASRALLYEAKRRRDAIPLDTFLTAHEKRSLASAIGGAQKKSRTLSRPDAAELSGCSKGMMATAAAL